VSRQPSNQPTKQRKKKEKEKENKHVFKRKRQVRGSWKKDLLIESR
jgi:hypothetical protein